MGPCGLSPGGAARVPESSVSQLADGLFEARWSQVVPTCTRSLHVLWGHIPSPHWLCLGSSFTCGSDPSRCLVIHVAPLESTAKHGRMRTHVWGVHVCEHGRVCACVGVCIHVGVQAQEKGMYTHLGYVYIPLGPCHRVVPPLHEQVARVSLCGVSAPSD